MKSDLLSHLSQQANIAYHYEKEKKKKKNFIEWKRKKKPKLIFDQVSVEVGFTASHPDSSAEPSHTSSGDEEDEEGSLHTHRHTPPGHAAQSKQFPSGKASAGITDWTLPVSMVPPHLTMD